MADFIISAFADETSDELEHQIAALKRNRLCRLEPRNIKGSLIGKTDSELFEIKKALDEAGISVPSYGSPIGKYDIDAPFEAHLKDFERALDVCEILCSPRMRMFSFFVPQERLSECRGEVMKRLSVMTERAAKRGVTLCHENESKIYGQNPGEAKDILTTVDGLYGVFDAANYVMNDQDPVAGFDATLTRFGYMHVKDAKYDGKMIAPAGMGDCQYEKLLRRASELDGTVLLTVEPHLHIFSAYAKIDSHKLKTQVEFDNSDDAFDYAVVSLKKVLSNIGYHEEGDKWIK